MLCLFSDCQSVFVRFFSDYLWEYVGFVLRLSGRICRIFLRLSVRICRICSFIIRKKILQYEGAVTQSHIKSEFKGSIIYVCYHTFSFLSKYPTSFRNNAFFGEENPNRRCDWQTLWQTNIVTDKHCDWQALWLTNIVTLWLKNIITDRHHNWQTLWLTDIVIDVYCNW